MYEENVALFNSFAQKRLFFKLNSRQKDLSLCLRFMISFRRFRLILGVVSFVRPRPLCPESSRTQRGSTCVCTWGGDDNSSLFRKIILMSRTDVLGFNFISEYYYWHPPPILVPLSVYLTYGSAICRHTVRQEDGYQKWSVGKPEVQSWAPNKCFKNWFILLLVMFMSFVVSDNR